MIIPNVRTNLRQLRDYIRRQFNFEPVPNHPGAPDSTSSICDLPVFRHYVKTRETTAAQLARIQ